MLMNAVCEAGTAVTAKIAAVFWDVTPCSLEAVHFILREKNFIHLKTDCRVNIDELSG
jgi:hypothetical protein